MKKLKKFSLLLIAGVALTFVGMTSCHRNNQEQELEHNGKSNRLSA